MKGTSKYLFICFVVFSAIALLSTTGMAAQFTGGGDVYDAPAFESQPTQLPMWSNPIQGDGDILIDNFEYHDSPLNHGWMQEEPPYPVWGFGIGYSLVLETVLDFAEGSRVMEAYRPASVFTLGTEYERYYVTKNLITPPSLSSPQGSQGISCAENGIISYKWRAPLGIEDWDIFRFEIIGSAGNIPFMIQIMPYQVWGGGLGAGNSTAKIGGYKAVLKESPSLNGSSAIVIQVDIGRNYNDGSWKIMYLDLNDIQTSAYADAGLPIGSEQIETAYGVRASGQQFRLDDITFRENDHPHMQQPDIYEMGPRFAQLFVPYRYLFMADYEIDSDAPLRKLSGIKQISDFMLDSGNFLTNKDQIRAAWIADLTALDPTHPVATDPSYADRWDPAHADYGTPDPVAERYLGRGFFIDVSLPVFANPEFRIAGSRNSEIQNHGVLGWNGTIGGVGANGIQTSNASGTASVVEPLPIYPYDGMPTYVPTYYGAGKALNAVGAFHYGPMLCYALESALWNSGMKFWPNIAFMDFLPKTMENLMLTVEVTNGRRSDFISIPITTVNYPVENYPPIVQVWASPYIFYVGRSNEYAIKFIDPDCFIFDLSQMQGSTPATDHLPGYPVNDMSKIRTDQDELVFSMTIDGLPSYQYGPFNEQWINPKTGQIKFTPQFEGKYRAVITARDPYGEIGIEDFPLYAVNTGTWLNHPPIITGCPRRPIVVKQGEEAIIASPDFIVTDVDGEEIYTSCNIGACGQLVDGRFVWSFQTEFVGIYNVEWVFYDDSGGYAVQRHTVEVVPWWTY